MTQDARLKVLAILGVVISALFVIAQVIEPRVKAASDSLPVPWVLNGVHLSFGRYLDQLAVTPSAAADEARPGVVIVSSDECSACKKASPQWPTVLAQELAPYLTRSDEIDFVSLHGDSLVRPSFERLAGSGIPLRLFRANDVRAFIFSTGVRVTPTLLVMDGAHVVRFIWTGVSAETARMARQEIRAFHAPSGQR